MQFLRHKFTQNELAARVGCSQTTIADYLAEKKKPSTQMLEAFADYLGQPVPVFVAYLYEYNFEGEVQPPLEAQIRELPLRRRLELLSVLARGIQTEAEDMLRDCGG